MSVTNSVQKIALDLGTEVVVHTAPLLAKVSPVRHAAIWAGEKYIRLAQNGADQVARTAARPPGVIADRTEFGQAILHTVDRIFARGLSPAVLRRFIDNMALAIGLGIRDDASGDSLALLSVVAKDGSAFYHFTLGLGEWFSLLLCHQRGDLT